MASQTELAYNIASMRLSGTIDGTEINAIAWSGGRGGTKTAGADSLIIKNNPFLTGLKHDEKKKESIGGPLPMGIYSLRLHESKSNWIRLIGKDITNAHGRSGFAIHGRGPEGSQGCIVPDDFKVVQSIYKLVKARKDAAKPEILLKVYAIGDLDYYEKLLSIS